MKFISSIFTLAMLLLMVGCAQVANSAPSQKYATTNDIQAEYDHRMAISNVTRKDWQYASVGGKIMRNILDEAGEAVRRRELARLSAEQVDAHSDYFESKLFRGLFEWYCDKEDTATLQSLLAANCPDGTDIPIGLAGLKQPEGMLVLTEAYFDAGDRPSAQMIVHDLRAVFDSWQKIDQTDTEFVRYVEKTWEENSANYVIKKDSPLFPQRAPDGGEKNDLFMLKPKTPPPSDQ